MRLNKIVLNNIFSFYDQEIIEFNNLTLIVAQNGLGKTSILNAIKLCLGYSDIEINYIFNNNSKSDICSISIDFDEFIITKVWDINTQIETLKIEFEDNEYLTDIEATEFIKEKIPFFLVDLLFYDGEINSNILLLSNTKLKHLFEFIFDLDLLANMNNDCIKASKELLVNDENKNLSSTYDNLKIKITDNEIKLQNLKDSKLLLENDIKQTKKDIQKLDKQIRKENKKLDTLKQELEKYFSMLNEKIILFKKAILFEMPLLLNKKLKNKITTKNKPILEVKNQNELNKKIDIFSQTLGLDNKQIKELFTTTFLNNSFDIKLSFSQSSFRQLLIEIKNIQNNIDTLKQEIKAIEENELTNELFQSINNSIISKNIELKKMQDELYNLDNNITQLIDTIRKLEKELTQLYKTKQKNFAIIKSYDSLKAISKVSQEVYDKELTIKLLEFNQALDNSTKEFRKIYSHIKNIAINENLRFEIIDTNNKRLNIELLSAGQKQVLNFLTIKTILDFKNFSNFLVVDTPFGRLSNKNKELIFNDCYSKFEQVTLLLTDSEFEFIKSKNLIFKNYEIFKDNFGSKIREIL